MAEEKKEMIMKVLTEFPDEKFNVKRLNQLLSHISYPTLLKWVMVLQAENKIRIEDYGNVKLVSLNKEYKKDDGNK